MTAVKNKVDRNYSFKDKNVDSFDVVETNNKTYIIPAGVGSTYWAILKVLFQNKRIELIVSESDDTSYLLSSPKNKEILLNSIKNIENSEKLIFADKKLFK